MHAEAPVEILRLQMAESDGESVCSVGRFRNFVHGKQCANKNLNVAFVGMAIAGDGSLYFARGIAENLDLMLRGGEKDNAANFGKAKRGLYIQGGKDRFHGNRVRRKFTNEAVEQRVNCFQG